MPGFNHADNLMSFLSRVRDAQQQRQPVQRPPAQSEMPGWARSLNPDDFKGATRNMLLQMQSRRRGLSGGAGTNDLIGSAGGDQLADSGASQLSSEELAAMVPFDTRAPAEKANDRLSSEQLAGMVPFDTRPRQSAVSPDTRQRLSPVTPDTRRRLSPVSEPRERVIGQEVDDPQDTEARAARRDQVAREDAVHPHPGKAPQEQPRHINMRKAFGPHVGGAGGSYIDMMRQHRRTGQLPDMRGMVGGGQGQARPQGTTAFRGATQPSEAARGQAQSAPRAAAVQPVSHSGGNRGGGGLFGGDGPGLGYIIGGIGSMLQEAGGQSGAVGNFVSQYSERQQQQRLTNQTRQAAIDLGIDPQFAQTAPISVLTPLLGEAYKQRNAGPQYEFKGDRWWQIGPDGVQPLTDPSPDQTIPGTTIGVDTAMGQKYAAFRNQGFDHETALGAASGRYDLRITDTGIPVKVDQLTNQEVPIQRHGPAEIERRRQLGPTPNGAPAQAPGRQAQSLPQQQGQPQQADQADPLGLGPEQQRTLYQMADSGTGLWNIMGDVFGRVAPQFAPGDKPFFPNQREAVTTIRTANRGLVRALQQSPRYAEGERKSIEQEIALNPSIGMSPEAWRQSAASVDRLLRNWWDEDMEDAQSNTLAAGDRQRALASARAIERYLQILGVPQGQGGGQRGGGGGGPVTVTSPEEAQSLPPGTPYRTPDGQLFRR